MTICVIENIDSSHEQFVLNLQELYPAPEHSVCPPDDKPCKSWREARKIVANLPKEGETVILLDLALEKEDEPTLGVETCKMFRMQRKKAILIAVTSHAKWLQRHIDSLAVFDAVIDKGQHDMKRGENVRRILRDVIDEARCRRAGIANPTHTEVKFRDSLGMRLAETALGEDSLQELIWKETKGWQNCVAQALTSGYSGSYLLELTGLNGGQPARLVLKMATKREILENEALAPIRYQAYLHRFAGKINASLSGVEQLDGREVFYCTQARVPGATLYQLLRQGPKANIQNAFEEILDHYRDQYNYAAENSTAGERTILQCFGFKPVDLHRIRDSCERLKGAADLLRRRGAWPSALHSPHKIFHAITDIAANWVDLVSKIKVPYWAVQHGDLHPGNVIVSGKQLSFIDLARFGPWPIGYDLSRLATQMRIHLPDHQSDEDWLFNGLHKWSQEQFAATDGSHHGSICEWASVCDQAFADFIATRPLHERGELQRLYEFMTLSDLMRIISYGTLSHFKRMWAAIACFQLGCRLGFCK